MAQNFLQPKIELMLVFVGVNAKPNISGATTGSLVYGVDDNGVEAAHEATKPNFEECMKKNTVFCMQMQAFRMARDFFDQPSFQILNGVTLDRVPSLAARNLGASDDASNAAEILTVSRDDEEREKTLENYIIGEAKNFFEKRNLRWNMAILARSFADAAPESLKQVTSDLMSQGRGRKKVLRVLLPFLLGLKVKFATIMGLTYLGVILLAKKALAIALLSIGISVFLLLKKMFIDTHQEVYPLGGHSGGWQSHSDTGHVEYAASPVAQQLAYGAQKPV